MNSGGFFLSDGISYSFSSQLLFNFLVELGLLCCTLAFSSYGKRGLVSFVVLGLLIAVTSLVAEHRL